MEVFNLPLWVVVALWFIKRAYKPAFLYCDIHSYYSSKIGYIRTALRMDDLLYRPSWLERQLRSVVRRYMRVLENELHDLTYVGVVGVGFIKKGERDE